MNEWTTERLALYGSELEIYLAIDYMTYYIWSTNHGDFSDDEREKVKETLKQYADDSNFLIRSLTRFGVRTDTSEIDHPFFHEKIKVYHEDVKRWKNHWNDWKHNMSREDRERFRSARNSNSPITEFLPKESWDKGESSSEKGPMMVLWAISADYPGDGIGKCASLPEGTPREKFSHFGVDPLAVALHDDIRAAMDAAGRNYPENAVAVLKHYRGLIDKMLETAEGMCTYAKKAEAEVPA